tara:strand:- start:554 stop:1060 length:507 start_codon:yes stop_codon:yes gene_type:complete
MLKLNNIKDKGSIKNRKRVGRGIGSGSGKTSGAGHKGQKSRAGVSIKGFEGGQMPLHRRLPKRGFKSPFRKEYTVINLKDISKAIKEKKLNSSKPIGKKELFKAGLIRKENSLVKILGEGKTEDKISLLVDKVSKKALSLIKAKDGKVELSQKTTGNDVENKIKKKDK